MKRELEDLAFPYVDHDAYTHTLEVRRLATKETEVGLGKVQKQLQRELAKKGLRDFRTEIRIKGLWSLHQKLKRKGEDITKIHDIAALRIIVPSKNDCYTVLGIVHTLYKPLPGEFKDYIAFKKPNGYQSLHTTVLTKEAGVVEMQIRTEAMHRNAQYGIASHMSYKQLGRQGSKGSFASLSFSWARWLIPSLLNFSNESKKIPVKNGEDVEIPHWLSELADAHTALSGPNEFVEGLKEDFFSHRVFLFTPEGDVVDMPQGATPIDFAYAIHTDLGNHTYGAKVNGKLASFDTELHNGDVVEILERKNAHPSPKWVDIVRTAMARKHVRTALGITEPKKQRKPRRLRKRSKQKNS
jgi:GTP pyrophosphokinase